MSGWYIVLAKLKYTPLLRETQDLFGWCICQIYEFW
jgi:hypothetical protein